MKGKKALPVNPMAWVSLREMPGTRVAFWAVQECPFCGAQHFHLAGARGSEPEERLGETRAPCQSATGQADRIYTLSLPPRVQTKGGKRAQQRRERRDSRRLWKNGALEEDEG